MSIEKIISLAPGTSMKKFQLTPDLRDHTKVGDGKVTSIPIHSANISAQLAAQGIDASVGVNHKTGECVIIYKDSIGAAKINAIKPLISSMPQYMSDLP